MSEQRQLDHYRDDVIEAVADAGMQAALDFAGAWVDEAWVELERLAQSGVEFSADDVASAVGPSPSDGAMGAVFRRAARERLIEPIGVTTSRRISRHGGITRLWLGTTVREAAEGRHRGRGSLPFLPETPSLAEPPPAGSNALFPPASTRHTSAGSSQISGWAG